MDKMPTFIERDPVVIMAECKAKMEELLGREIFPAQVEQLLLDILVYRETLLVERFNAGMAQMLCQFSGAPVLDYLAALVSVERIPADYATCTVCFALVEGHMNVIIPAGTRVATADGNAVFATLEDVVITPSTISVDVEVIAQTSGRSCNNYAPGTVNTILDPLAFVSAVGNIDTTNGGSDTETDESLRERMRLAPSHYSTAGPADSYRYYAMSANAAIIDVSVNSYIPGTVSISVLTEFDQTPPQILTDVYNACTPKKVRPLNDTVIVVAPKRKEYTINVNIVLAEDADAVAVKSTVQSLLNTYTASNRNKLGCDIIKSRITQLCRPAGVHDACVQEPAENITVAADEFAVCIGATINITGYNHE